MLEEFGGDGETADDDPDGDFGPGPETHDADIVAYVRGVD